MPIAIHLILRKAKLTITLETNSYILILIYWRTKTLSEEVIMNLINIYG